MDYLVSSFSVGPIGLVNACSKKLPISQVSLSDIDIKEKNVDQYLALHYQLIIHIGQIPDICLEVMLNSSAAVVTAAPTFYYYTQQSFSLLPCLRV